MTERGAIRFPMPDDEVIASASMCYPAETLYDLPTCGKVSPLFPPPKWWRRPGLWVKRKASNVARRFHLRMCCECGR